MKRTSDKNEVACDGISNDMSRIKMCGYLYINVASWSIIVTNVEVLTNVQKL